MHLCAADGHQDIVRMLVVQYGARLDITNAVTTLFVFYIVAVKSLGSVTKNPG